MARHAPNQQQKGWGSSKGVTLTGEEPVKWQTPLKAGPSLRMTIGTGHSACFGNRSEGRGTGVPVVRETGWGRKAQPAPGQRKEGLLKWGRKSYQHLGLRKVREHRVQRYR